MLTAKTAKSSTFFVKKEIMMYVEISANAGMLLHMPLEGSG